jgi:ring-1,2-phenylacetyl-CoA epoxidase subunit PaaD
LAIAGAVLDPEIPVLTLDDLGVLRGASIKNGRLTICITPTYTGCPAVLAIELAVEAALLDGGFTNAYVERVLSPTWSTDQITEAGREKLKAYGIAPPARAGKRARTHAGKGALLFTDDLVTCPRCSSPQTSKISEFGSTACKAQWRCNDCREPFDYFKCL